VYLASKEVKPPEPAPTSARLSEAAEAWDRTKDTTNIVVLEAFIGRYKETYYADLGRLRIKELRKQRCDGGEAQVGSEKGCLKPQHSFRDCPTCPEMAVVPAGAFTMGSPTNEPRPSNEEVQVPVSIGEPFAVGKYAVTFDEWDACIADGGCNGYRSSHRGWGRGKQPVIESQLGRYPMAVALFATRPQRYAAGA
jgi:formylglycine-generating enzyme required for sulfatase activity